MPPRNRVYAGFLGCTTSKWILLLFLTIFRWHCDALQHRYKIRSAGSLVAPIGTPFGFLTGGHYELTVYNWKLVNLKTKQDLPQGLAGTEAGFYLQRFENEAQFTKYIEIIASNSSACVFEYEVDDDPLEMDDAYDGGAGGGVVDSAENGILLSMNSNTKSIAYNFKAEEQGLYFLMYQLCPPNKAVHIGSSFEVEYHWYNYDRMGYKSYLPAGEMMLPSMYLFFSISYLICLGFWTVNIRMIQNGGPGIFLDNRITSHQRPTLYAIHHLMSVLIFLKFLTVATESIRYHYIRVYGSAEFWSILYYVVNFCRGTFLFTVILLIGVGWSIVKPFLNVRERNVILFVLFLQVVNNLALIVSAQEISGEKSFDRWTAVLHLMDIACCCVVLLPIVWQINALEKTVGLEEEVEEVDLHGHQQKLSALEPDSRRSNHSNDSLEKQQILSKLRLFRSFYLLVVAYIYATRILIYLFATILSYKYIWLRYFVVELVTLLFYVTAGLMFRPQPENVYGVYTSISRTDNNDDDDEVIYLNGRGGETELADRTA